MLRGHMHTGAYDVQGARIRVLRPQSVILQSVVQNASGSQSARPVAYLCAFDADPINPSMRDVRRTPSAGEQSL